MRVDVVVYCTIPPKLCISFIYDPMVGSFHSFILSQFTPPLSFLRTIELPFVIITYNCRQNHANNCVQLFTTSCVFCSIVQSYVIQGQYVFKRYYAPITYSITSQFRDILIGRTKYQGIYGYFCDDVFKYFIVTVTCELPIWCMHFNCF